MRNLLLIMVLCFALLNCKSRKSHVQKSSLDSLGENREFRNLEIQASAFRSQNTSLVQGTNWLNAVSLVNFSGIIFRDGTIEGTAEAASVNQSGNTNSILNNETKEQDSTTLKGTGEIQSKAQVKKKEYDRQKEVKGIRVPWWVWLAPVLALLIWVFAKRIKSFLKPF